MTMATITGTDMSPFLDLNILSIQIPQSAVSAACCRSWCRSRSGSLRWFLIEPDTAFLVLILIGCAIRRQVRDLFSRTARLALASFSLTACSSLSKELCLACEDKYQNNHYDKSYDHHNNNIQAHALGLPAKRRKKRKRHLSASAIRRRHSRPACQCQDPLCQPYSTAR